MTVDIIVLICGIVIVVCAYLLGRIEGKERAMREITGKSDGPTLVIGIPLKDITEARAEEIRQTILEAKEIYQNNQNKGERKND